MLCSDTDDALFVFSFPAVNRVAFWMGTFGTSTGCLHTLVELNWACTNLTPASFVLANSQDFWMPTSRKLRGYAKAKVCSGKSTGANDAGDRFVQAQS